MVALFSGRLVIEEKAASYDHLTILDYVILILGRLLLYAENQLNSDWSIKLSKVAVYPL